MTKKNLKLISEHHLLPGNCLNSKPCSYLYISAGFNGSTIKKNTFFECNVSVFSGLFTPTFSLRLSTQIEVQKASHISSLLFLV